jgi:signal transduction histidine kinase/DNA-binding response OmpR family regulator
VVRLPSGKYHFKVKASSYGDNDAYTKEMDFHIKPHPLLSKVAKVMYSIVLIALVTALILMIELKRKRDKARNISKIISMKEKELYNAKIHYFTNITHEIRTPLTLIKLPLDKIIAKGAYTPESEKDLRTMQANADRLLSLTNQLLDMRKMEENEIKLSCVRENICEIVRKASRYFEQMALEQHISLITDIPERPIWVMCAKDSIITIVSNLMSNAVKYGKDRICVSVSESEDRQKIFIRVESNGSHIPENESEKIFNIFFQRPSEHVKGRISQGTGLGLPYARTLANMHNGRLYLDVNVSDMNSFVLELPVQQEKQVVLEERKTEEKPAGREARYDSSRYSIMIVEDSEEMRSYLASELSDSYNVSQAANGEEALAILKSEKIDIVISDIMMPVMDGCKLCNKIKTDSDLSHIPVILLTAAIGVETHIETLEVGADGYIEKPFPIELLRSNISNLFKNREISYRQFITKPLTHYNSVTASKVDNEFMTRLHEFIMKNIAEQDLNIDNLTSQLGTSKSSLYRKLKANTGLSINEYIRVCRLKQAAELLSSQKYKINEVAFMTGFSSASYFATCFQRQFEITPSEFIRNLEQ